MAKTRPELCSGKSPHTGKDTRNGALTDRIQIRLVIPFDRGIRESGAITGVFAVQWMHGDEIPFCRELCGFRAIPQTQRFLQIRFILGTPFHTPVENRLMPAAMLKKIFYCIFYDGKPRFFPFRYNGRQSPRPMCGNFIKPDVRLVFGKKTDFQYFTQYTVHIIITGRNRFGRLRKTFCHCKNGFCFCRADDQLRRKRDFP